MSILARFLALSVVSFSLLAVPASSFPRTWPNVIVGLGDSITQAANTCCEAGDHPMHSWSTGDGQSGPVRSHYERLVSLYPQIRNNHHNHAASGAKAADLPAQADKAVAQEADYVTILIGANDLCASSASNMTSPAEFAQQVAAALDTLHQGLPRARVYVSSIPDLYQLWSVLHRDQDARRVWASNGSCPSVLAGTEAQRQEVAARQAVLNRILADTCRRHQQCSWDGGAVYNHKFQPDQISTMDYFHPSPAGQAALADITWKAFHQAPLRSAAARPSAGWTCLCGRRSSCRPSRTSGWS